MRRYIAIILALTIAGCGNPKTLAPDGNITVVGAELRKSIQKDDLTDPDAYFQELEKVLTEAPPQNFKDEAAQNKRSEFLQQRLGKFEKGYFLMPVSCSDEKSSAYLQADKNAKTLKVNLMRVDDVLRIDFQKMADKIDVLTKRQTSRFFNSIRGVRDIDSDFEDENKVSIRALDEKGAQASAIRFDENRLVTVTNNPLSYLQTQIGLAFSESNLSIAQAGLAALRGNIGDVEPGTARLNELSRLLQGAANGHGPSGWTASIPFDDNQPVCLIGHFDYLDPVPGGLYAHFTHAKGASYSTSLKAWYLVKKANLEVVHSQSIAEE